ncbi:hypothetical protein AAHE18_15G209300 [Arachis hypogaea]
MASVVATRNVTTTTAVAPSFLSSAMAAQATMILPPPRLCATLFLKARFDLPLLQLSSASSWWQWWQDTTTRRFGGSGDLSFCRRRSSVSLSLRGWLARQQGRVREVCEAECGCREGESVCLYATMLWCGVFGKGLAAEGVNSG